MPTRIRYTTKDPLEANSNSRLGRPLSVCGIGGLLSDTAHLGWVPILLGLVPSYTAACTRRARLGVAGLLRETRCEQTHLQTIRFPGGLDIHLVCEHCLAWTAHVDAALLHVHLLSRCQGL